MADLTMKSTTRLANGVEMPLLGLNTGDIGRNIFNIQSQKEIFKAAIDAGFRYFDTAETYRTGRALGAAIKESGIPREEFFISSKLQTEEMTDGRFFQAFEENLFQLDTDYLDLYSIHWPIAMTGTWPERVSYIVAYTGREISKTENGDTDGLIQIYEKGLTRAIGVCNYEQHHLEELLADPCCTIKPMINQAQFHPLYQAGALRKYCAEQGIVFGAFNEHDDTIEVTKPAYVTDVHRLGFLFQTDERRKKANWDIRVPKGYEFDPNIQKDPYDRSQDPRKRESWFEKLDALVEIGGAHGKTTDQVMTRWSLQHGIVTTPAAWKRAKIRELADVFDFTLSAEEMQVIDAMHVGLRFGAHPDYVDF